MKLLSTDTPIGRAIALLADLCILNLLFFLSCIPIVTMGASIAALYDTAFALLSQECGGITRHFFSAFGRHFKKSTVLFLISAAVGAFIAVDLICAMSWDSFMAMLCLGVILASAFLFFSEIALIPLVLIRSGGTVKQILKESFLSAIRGSWRTVAAVVMNVLPWVLLLFAPAVFLNTWMFWFLVGFGITAYLNVSVLLKAVDPETAESLKTKRAE